MTRLLFLLIVLLITGCSAKPTRHSIDELIIVATADFHSALDRAEGLASVIRTLKKRYGEQMLYVDGGDLFQGSLEGNLSKGKSIVEFFNLIGLDAAAIGNHELDYGPDVVGRVNVNPGEDGIGSLRARVREASFRWLSSNWVKTNARRCKFPQRRSCSPEKHNALGQETVFAPRAVFSRAGHKACVIGATTPSTPDITRPAFVKGTKFEELAPVVLAEAKYLRKKENCDFVLLVAHAGLLCDPSGNCLHPGDRAEILRLLQELPVGTVDAVIAGHTHFEAREQINGTPVLEAGTAARSVGVLHLKRTSTGVSHHFESFISVPEHAQQDDITIALKPYREGASEIKSRIVGSATDAFQRNYLSENPLGNMIADALLETGRETQGAQFALINAGGLRENLPSGVLTYGDIFKVVPFDNSLAIVELTGAELRRLLEIAESGGHGVSPVSGLHIKRLNLMPGQRGSWDRDLNQDGKTEDWERLALIDLTDNQGQPIKNDAHYKIATADFLTLGGDHQSFLYKTIPASRKHVFEGVLIRDVLLDYLKKKGEIRPQDYFDAKRPRIEQVPVLP